MLKKKIEFEVRCPRCGHSWETKRRGRDYKSEHTCPKCTGKFSITHRTDEPEIREKWERGDDPEDIFD